MWLQWCMHKETITVANTAAADANPKNTEANKYAERSCQRSW